MNISSQRSPSQTQRKSYYQGPTKATLVAINPSTEEYEAWGLRPQNSGLTQDKEGYNVQLVWKVQVNPTTELYVSQGFYLREDPIINISKGAWVANNRGQLIYVTNDISETNSDKFLEYCANIAEYSKNNMQKKFVNSDVRYAGSKMNLYHTLATAFAPDPNDENNDFNLLTYFTEDLLTSKKDKFKELDKFVRQHEFTAVIYIYVATSDSGAIYMNVDSNQVLTTVSQSINPYYIERLKKYFNNAVQGGKTPFSKSGVNLPLEFGPYVVPNTSAKPEKAEVDSEDDLPF